MKSLPKEFIKNKGSTLLPCVFSILLMVSTITFVYLSNLVSGVGKTNYETLTRVFCDNVFNEIDYNKKFTFSNYNIKFIDQAYAFYYRNNTYYKVQNAEGYYERIQYYEKDKSGNIIKTDREVHSE